MKEVNIDIEFQTGAKQESANKVARRETAGLGIIIFPAFSKYDLILQFREQIGCAICSEKTMYTIFVAVNIIF